MKIFRPNEATGGSSARDTPVIKIRHSPLSAEETNQLLTPPYYVPGPNNFAETGDFLLPKPTNLANSVVSTFSQS